ncbi:helicase associated domain-containing protein [Mycobacterium bohemicum]|uniref:helicase associated domain-containing protein n=1 Tax=Mycobacterium bohemicum TaxID=56425 RepID=UPI003555CE2A
MGLYVSNGHSTRVHHRRSPSKPNPAHVPPVLNRGTQPRRKPLGKWLSVQRRTWQALSEERRRRLQQLPGWTLDARGRWREEGFNHLQRYVEANGNARFLRAAWSTGSFNLGL